VAPIASPAFASANSRHGLTGRERHLVRLINQVRRTAGLRPVRVSSDLVRAARQHSHDMLVNNYFAHGQAVSRICRFLTGARLVGETLAWGTGTLGTPQSTLDRWLASPPHRAVLLDPAFRLIGVGRAHGRFLGNNGAWLYTADFGG
jgi:uncharacterized protein YkwD